jgi:hypothetical protein
MDERDHQEPCQYECSFEGDGYEVVFSRYDGYLNHSVCHLDIISSYSLATDAFESMILLNASPWQLTLVYDVDSPGSLPGMVCAATSEMYPPGRPLCGFRISGIPWDMALRLIDGFRRSGNLVLHIIMSDSIGDRLEIQTPILPNTFFVFDPTGVLNERLLSYVGRN